MLLGLILGSFLNVCIYRIPRGESIVTPPSHCPKCGKRIRFYDNIPVLSYLLLRGRCRFCRCSISLRYPTVELFTGLLFIAAFAKFGYTWMTPKALVMVCFLVTISAIDLEHQIIPFCLSIPGLVVGLASGFLPSVSFVDGLFGALAGAGFVLLAWLLWRYVLARIFRHFGVDQKEGMGGGDLPFAAMIGGFLGLKNTGVALFAAVVAGVIIGLIMRAAGKARRGQQIPFGPFLALGALVGLFFGSEIFNWYLSLTLG
ncbi:hypothetical protein CH330_06130 [candidate division WOR-3 bacterium JGI_Cruoil_03_51_56]|uniref:Prepilin peptidase n=1 Tax=candidate division WOR-3 bacterium JGI_Cruoil_03_51_56 TaxID=1973747 RepID=A0A235BUQ0_UNCW3|nr:MAG: hypothetical protein CH330_06130 [candidate division WOR-3 bacterium JGI_Cruoil_03_51_56]